jgi:hypothetical protein
MVLLPSKQLQRIRECMPELTKTCIAITVGLSLRNQHGCLCKFISNSLQAAQLRKDLASPVGRCAENPEPRKRQLPGQYRDWVELGTFARWPLLGSLPFDNKFLLRNDQEPENPQSVTCPSLPTG